MHLPFNRTFLALIPKKDEPISFKDFRLITLCNCIYKFVAKIISRCLKPVLSEVISKKQFGFLNGRQIHEAIGVEREGLHSLRSLQSKGVVLKIDLSKAFDHVSWSFIRLLLTHLGFEVPFIRWIMVCISSVSFAVLINGAASPFFSSRRSLRHGCPLSPLLVAEGLSKALISAINTRDFQSIKTSPDLGPRDVETLATILQLFRDATGMIINSKKSTLSFIGIDEATATLYKTLFPFPIQEIQQGIKYIGFQLKANNYLKRDWSWLLAKLEKRLSLWSFRWLSREGRLTLTKAVLEAIPVY